MIIKNAKTAEEFVALQTDEEIKKLTADAILTLAGIKLLKTQFKENIKEWRFVAAKGIQQAKALIGSPQVSIDALLDKLVLEIAF